MQLRNRSSKKEKRDKVQKYASIIENSKFQSD